MTRRYPAPETDRASRALPLVGPRNTRHAHWATAVALLALSGCMTAPPANQPLETGEAPDWVHESQIASTVRSGRVLLVLTFSGGGTRAAAFSYGVLQELAGLRLPIDGEQRRAIDEVDVISSVSGGSFTAAYFGLHGDGIFDDYEQVFLRKNVQRGLVFEVLRPRYWLGFLRVDRSQLAARYYDRKIFHGAEFRDLQRPGGPEIVMNATDLSTAQRFPFSRQIFAYICSDLASFPVSQAVTASSAVPIVFPTVRLRNYSGSCGFEPPEFATAPRPRRDAPPLQQMLREQIATSAAELEDRQYIHLLDGGLSDNLGLANGVAAITMLGDHAQALRALGHGDLELILVITVNAEPKSEHGWDALDKPATTVQVVSGLTGAGMDQRNRMVVGLAKAGFSEMAGELSTPEKPVRFEFVDVSFERVADPDERKYLRSIETSFTLSDQKVDRLIAAGRKLLRESPELHRAMDWLAERDAARAAKGAPPSR